VTPLRAQSVPERSEKALTQPCGLSPTGDTQLLLPSRFPPPFANGLQMPRQPLGGSSPLARTYKKDARLVPRLW
jgi:hypothetical protein